MADIFEDTVGEVKAIVNDTERCANDIFEAAESIVEQVAEIDEEQLRNAISENVTKIFESCHFQDFSGQRATKIIENLEEIQAKTGPMEKHELSEEESLKQGPQIDDVSQEDIDKLFNES